MAIIKPFRALRPPRELADRVAALIRLGYEKQLLLSINPIATASS